MDLFDSLDQYPINLLPKDGEANYYGVVLSRGQADQYFQTLLNTTHWVNDNAIIYGKHLTTKRKIAWYGDRPFRYTYSKITRQALEWTPVLLELKKFAEEQTQETYNSCLANLYHDGSEGMAWHSDAEKDLQKNGAIASLTFGAERKFSFKHKVTQENISQVLEHGSLLVMKGETQSHWLHRLPPTKTVHPARINLTFRTIAY